LVLFGCQIADGQTRTAAQKDVEQLNSALQTYELEKRFSILPWDQMRLLDGPAHQSHWLASLVDCNFSHAGFVRVADLPACEKLGLRAIVQPDANLKLDKVHHLSDADIDQ